MTAESDRLRWAAVAPLVICSWAGACVSGTLVAGGMNLWVEPIAGSCSAVAVVLAAYLAAPRSRLTCATLSLALGGVAAWWLLDPPSWTPESWGAAAYQPTYTPILATWAGGVVGWAGCAAHAAVKRRTSGKAR